MLEDVDRDRRDRDKKEIEVKLPKYVDVHNVSQRLLKALQEDKETWEKKLVDVKAKAKYINYKEKSLLDSLDDSLLFQ